jgi:cytochrome bd-type quinol oxidase subunit 1
MTLDPLLLSRLQFAWVVAWHISDVTANVLSPLLVYEGLMAFFVESAFLGVLLGVPRQGTGRYRISLAC